MVFTHSTARPSPTTALEHDGDVDVLRHFTRPAIVVHQAMRREFRLAGPLVRRVADGDTERAQLVGRHLDLLLRGLRRHHELEDDQIWPSLHDRLPAEAQSCIALMEDQHRGLDLVIERIEQLLAVWSTDLATVAAVREPLGDELAELDRQLTIHLDMEEHAVLPLAERAITAAEWVEIGRLAETGNPRRERLVAFGMLQYEGDPQGLASMLATAPAPVRILLPRLSRRAYRRYAIAIHGTPNP